MRAFWLESGGGLAGRSRPVAAPGRAGCGAWPEGNAPAALAGCSAPSLRLLFTFLAVHDPRGVASALGDDARTAASSSACRLACRCVEASTRGAQPSRALHALLEHRLHHGAARFRGLGLFDLANLWSVEQRRLRGRHLAALLWVVASHPCPLFRRLEEAVVRRIDGDRRWCLLDEGDDLLAT